LRRLKTPFQRLIVLIALTLGLACSDSTSADLSSGECAEAARAQAEAEFALGDAMVAHSTADAALDASGGAADALAEHDRSQDQLVVLRSELILAEAGVRQACG